MKISSFYVNSSVNEKKKNHSVDGKFRVKFALVWHLVKWSENFLRPLLYLNLSLIFSNLSNGIEYTSLFIILYVVKIDFFLFCFNSGVRRCIKLWTILLIEFQWAIHHVHESINNVINQWVNKRTSSHKLMHMISTKLLEYFSW